MAAGQRCDMVSQDRCMDITTLESATIRVPLTTTRLSPEGLNLCGIPGTIPEPTDIVYIMDQSTSMVPQMILPGAEDTSGWFECNNRVLVPMIRYVDTIMFHGQSVAVAAPTTTLADMSSVCSIAGDPYSVRLSTVQNAIRFQADKSPSSYASVVSFHGNMDAAQMTMTQLSTPAKVQGLLNAVPLMSTSGTNYEEPLTWARIQLYGGTSGATTIAPSADTSKAIIMISDGQPNAGFWQNSLRATNSVTWNGKVWTTSSPRIPPVYTIFLGVDGAAGAALQGVAQQTGGAYYQIPPYMPDSLTKVINEILGKVIKPSRPDSLFVTNLTNGQSAKSVASTATGNSFRMTLDSLVALEPGSNNLSIKVKQGTKTITANWTVLVADTSSTFPKGPLDTVIGTRCGPATTLTVKPDKSGLAWADSVDRNLLLTLTTASAGSGVLPLNLVTLKSKDAEQIGISVPVGTNPSTITNFQGTIPWADLSWDASVPGDFIVRSGSGWDSARFTFQMPRDRRDTASAQIGLHRPRTPLLVMTEEMTGPLGRIDVIVVDSEATASTVSVVVKHRLGDSLKVTLTKGADGYFRGSFPFQEAVVITPRDTVLQLGPTVSVVDSVIGTYLRLTASTRILLPAARLRFLDVLGKPHDTLSLSMSVGDKSRVVVQAYMGEDPCLSCTGWVRFAASDYGISVRSILGSGAPIDSLQLVSGKLQVDIRGISPVLVGSLSFLSDSLGSQIWARPIKIAPLLPDSVVYFDDDGDGDLDRADVHLRMPWSNTNGLRLPWPDSTKLLDIQTAGISISADTSVLTFTFTNGVALTTTANGALVAKWRWNEAWDWASVKVVEHIAPVPLRAVLHRGKGFDTLRVSVSEKVWPTLTPTGKLISKWMTDGSFTGVSPRLASLDGGTGDLVLVFPADSTEFQVNPGDSIRFANAGSIRDLLGNIPGEMSRRVVVEGIDRAPLSAWLFDTNADGRADRVVVRLRTPIAVVDSIGFNWPNRSGAIETRLLPIQGAKRDSADRILTFDIDPFAFGATSCPSEGCQNLAWFTTSRFPDMGKVAFPLEDRVDPIILEAKYQYGYTAALPDSMLLLFSEKLESAGNGPWIAWGKPRLDSLGKPVLAIAEPRLLADNRALVLLDSTFLAGKQDSVRIFAKPQGGLTDTAGNAAMAFAHWTPLVFGAPPIRITVGVPNPVMYDKGEVIPVGEDPVRILVRRSESDTISWTPLPGTKELPRPLGQFSGITIDLNRIPDEGAMYIYDLMGVSVVKVDLSSLKAAADAGLLSRTRRGDYQIFLAWNGCDATGKKVATGIYLARVFGWIRENNVPEAVNVVKKMGIRRALKDNIDPY